METMMESSEPKIDQKTLEILKEKLLRITRTAESVALHSIRKVRFLAALGIISAGWLAFFLWRTFDLSLPATLPLLLILTLPSILLGKLYFVLRETIGLPQRLNESLDRIRTGSVELHQRLKKPDQFDPAPRKRKFTDLWRLAKAIREIKALGKEADQIIAVLGGALILSNPVFAVVVLVSGVITLLLSAAALATCLYSLL